MLYLITKHDHYYPNAGTGDWVVLHKERPLAVHAFQQLPLNADQCAFLIEIDSIQATWAVLDSRDGETELEVSAQE